MVTKIIMFAFAFFQVERARIETNESNIVHPAPPSEVRGSATRALASASQLRVENGTLKHDSAAQRVTYSFRLVNSTDHSLELPIGKNGDQASRTCPDAQVSVISISFHEPWMKPLETLPLAVLYGCKELVQSTVQLQPGDWISFGGEISPKGHFESVDHAEFLISFGQRRYFFENGKPILLDRPTTIVRGDAQTK